MVNTEDRDVDRAIATLADRNVFRTDTREFHVRSLFPVSSWRPLAAAWWKKKQASVIGEDPGGNLYLRMCDGSVLYWDHATQSDEVLAPSVRGFLSSLAASTTHDPQSTPTI